MVRPAPPCDNCSMRSEVCHSICKHYADFKAALNKYNELVRKAKNEDNDFYEASHKKYNYAAYKNATKLK